MSGTNGERAKAMLRDQAAVATEAPAVAGVLRQLYFSLYGIFFLLSLLLSILLFAIAAGINGTAEAILLGVATSLLASAVFSSLQVLLTEQVSKKLLKETVAGEMQDVAERVIADARHQQQRYVPVAVYEESGSPGGRFNRDLAKDLAATNRYIYFGLTGRYVGARLCELPHRIDQVQVVICDPSTEVAIATRMRHASTEPGPVPDRERIQQELIEYTDCCIVGLFASRLRHEKIKICLTPTPNFDRVEICDAAAYLTLFSTSDDQRMAYPQTLRFSPDSAFYAMMLRDRQRASNAPGAKVLRLRATTSEQQLLDFYANDLGRPITLDDLHDMQAKFEERSADFHRQVERALARTL